MQYIAYGKRGRYGENESILMKYYEVNEASDTKKDKLGGFSGMEYLINREINFYRTIFVELCHDIHWI